MTNDCKTCPVSTGTHKPAEAVHQIDEPQAEALLELAAYRFTVANRDARIAELEGQLEAIGAGGVEPLRKQAAAPQAVQAAVPDNWRDQFSGAVYEDLSAADNQDVPLEEYPARILNILDAIVGPRHPTVIKWRNDAIRSCIAIAYKYCSDPESYRYLKQDLEVMLAATQPAAQGMDAQSWADFEALRHSANEWADMATNGLQWLRNIVDGISDPQQALMNLESNLTHCRAVNDVPAAQRAIKAIAAALAAQAKQGGAANG